MDIRTVSAAIMLATLAAASVAQQPDVFDACAKETDSTARLACFDREIAKRRATHPAPTPAATATPAPVTTMTATPAVTTAPAAAVTAPAPAPATAEAAASTATPAPARTASSDIGLDARQQRRERRQRGEPEPPPPAPIVARVVRVIPREPLISAFELDNGQIWEQSEAMKFSARPQEQITIRHGVLGAFFLKSADGAVVRAHRVK